MLTPFVTALVIGNRMAAFLVGSIALVCGAGSLNFRAPVLTVDELPPIRLSGWDGGAARPFDIVQLKGGNP
jgi:hypothetical protein